MVQSATAGRDAREAAARRWREDRTECLVRRLASARAHSERQRLRQEIVLLNTPVAESVAARYRHRGAEHEDVLQVAHLALVKAVDRYNAGRGSSFVGFAVPTITGEVKRYFRDQCWSIRPTRRLQELQQAIQASEPALTQELGRSPRPREIATDLGVSTDDVIEALACEACFNLLPLDAPTSTEGSVRTPADTLGQRDELLEYIENRQLLEPLLAQLSHRERLLLHLRFDEGCTQSQIARRLGISQMQVSRRLKAVLSRLRERLQDEPQRTARSVRDPA
jgi:RNA polymerase sigma-B factor